MLKCISRLQNGLDTSSIRSIPYFSAPAAGYIKHSIHGVFFSHTVAPLCGTLLYRPNLVLYPALKELGYTSLRMFDEPELKQKLIRT